MKILQLELRSEAERDPMLRGVLIQEGRASTGGRRELFAPGAIEWPAAGIAVRTKHLGKMEARGQLARGRDGVLNLTAPATPAIVQAYEQGKRFLSVEFVALEDEITAGGVREIRRAFVDGGAMVLKPEYEIAQVEVRNRVERASSRGERYLLWL